MKIRVHRMFGKQKWTFSRIVRRLRAGRFVSNENAVVLAAVVEEFRHLHTHTHKRAEACSFLSHSTTYLCLNCWHEIKVDCNLQPFWWLIACDGDKCSAIQICIDITRIGKINKERRRTSEALLHWFAKKFSATCVWYTWFAFAPVIRPKLFRQNS